MLLCESVCTHYPSPLSVHNTPPLGLVFMLLCESVCTPLPLPCESVHITPCLWVCTHYPSPGFGVHVGLWVCLYTIPLPCVWCSSCSVSLSVHTTLSLGLVFMLPCEPVCKQCPSPGFGVHVALWVCTHYPSTEFGVHVALWVCLYTLPLPCECTQYPSLGLVFMLLCESACTPLPLPCESVHITPRLWVCTHNPSPGFGVHVGLWVCLYTIPLPCVWCSSCSVSLSVHTTLSLSLVFMLPCEPVCTHCPSPGFGVHVALWVCTHYPSTGFGVHVALWICLYTITLPWVWCSCYSVSLSVHNNPPWDWCSCCSMSLSVHTTPLLGLVFMLLCESVCTQLPSPGFGVHVALWVCLYTLPPLCLVFMLLCESVCTQLPSPGFGVHVALWVCLYTLPLPWVWCSCCSVSMSVHTTLPCVWCSCYFVSLSVHNYPPLGLVFMLLCESVCTHYPSTGFGVHVALWVCLYTMPLPWVWCSCCSVSLSVHTTPLLGLVFMLPCESVFTQCPYPGFGVHVALWIRLYTLPLYRVWCSCYSVSVCIDYHSPVSLSVHNTVPLPWVWYSCCSVFGFYVMFCWPLLVCLTF